MTSRIVAIAADHAGFELKTCLREALRELGHDALDLGTHGLQSVDYPDFAAALAAALEEGKAARGVLICGSGIGISIAANRHRHVRAALCRDVDSTRLARRHNDANVLAIGARFTDAATAVEMLRTFLATPFEGGRHTSRVAKLGGV